MESDIIYGNTHYFIESVVDGYILHKPMDGRETYDKTEWKAVRKRCDRLMAKKRELDAAQWG